jgi:hypothetical protein
MSCSYSHLRTMLCMNSICVLYELCHLCAMWFKNYVMYDLCVLCHVVQYDLCLLFESRLMCNGAKDNKKPCHRAKWT